MSIENKDSFNIPADPKILKQIKDGMQELSDSKLRQSSETALQKDIYTRLSKETGVPKKVLRKLAKVKSDEGGIDKLVSEVGSLEALNFAINNSKTVVEEKAVTPFYDGDVAKAVEEFGKASLREILHVDLGDEIGTPNATTVANVESLMNDLEETDSDE